MQPPLSGLGRVKHLIAVFGQFIDFGLQRLDAPGRSVSPGHGLLNVQLSQSLIQIQQERAFLGCKHFNPRSAVPLT